MVRILFTCSTGLLSRALLMITFYFDFFADLIELTALSVPLFFPFLACYVKRWSSVLAALEAYLPERRTSQH
uniref:Uncharacterized protein n=1 Tax=Utricularia reniformis TaxID=192314 RepID=A0A1Y0AZF2_9LAMI|nr:hypothetical protein AEK19_MT0242 [Utricularia reniformis]ART30520.1 hypothetical protein AEK19_MT0242 [Utricularia reniformis]